MTLLHLLSYAAAILAFLFLTLSLACGLYYLAELVEEYTVLTKKIIKKITLVDGCETFPFINLTSLTFITSCVLVLADHFLWFQYFTSRYFAFVDVAAFFGICVWLIPFSYFISLSANDNALPSFDPNIGSIPSRNKTGLLKNLLNFILQKKDDVIPTTSTSNSSNITSITRKSL
ncbi:DUF396-domain-containing protein [Rhizophagus clarus]|uniref:DUF396-domain-containing protein n=1 Tax=Rhizophagus clarus TaxID=94130 RepID=A0A8H3LWA8_9GLOM|nr:DUF396-domain-containing protein [Rhizophagus clarus]